MVSLSRLNNRTHRELLIVDEGGICRRRRHWRPVGARREREKPWRDTMARVTGPWCRPSRGLTENWIDVVARFCAARSFSTPCQNGTPTAVVIKSSPADRATACRWGFRCSSRARQAHPDHHAVFFADTALREALIATARRAVAIDIIVPVRIRSAVGAPCEPGEIQRAAARGNPLYEYRAGMTPAKVLNVDGLGGARTTNFDNRSFEHNDEVNLAIRDGTCRRASRETSRRILHAASR